MTQEGSPRGERKGIGMADLTRMFPDDDSAQSWLEGIRWPERRYCPRCGHTATTRSSHKTMPYWCGICREYFSVKTGTVMQTSRLGYRKWVFGIHMASTGLKGVSSAQLHRDLGVTWRTAGRMFQKIRQGWLDAQDKPNDNPHNAKQGD